MDADAARLDPRVVETYCTAEADAQVVAGSGYLLDSGLVLTSAHTLPSFGGVRWVSVKCAHDPLPRTCELVWSHFDDPSPRGGPDAALLRITDPGWREPAGLAPLRWGRLVTVRDQMVVTGTGFPAAMKTHDEDGRLLFRDTVQFEGWIVRRSGRTARGASESHPPWQIRLTTPGPPAVPISGARQSQRWKGLSGSAVLAHGLLLGLATAASPEPHAAELTVLPTAALFEHDGFRALVGPASLEPAELESLLSRRSAPNVYSPASLLHPDAQAVGFHGREATMRRLEQWCAAPGQITVRLVTGRGGQGKTRLGREFVDRMRDAGWAAGFLEEGATPADLAVLGRIASRALIVIDYAEARAHQILAVLEAASASPLRPRGRDRSLEIRILLLARDTGDWWDDVKRALPGTRRLSDGSVLPLPDLEPRAADRPAAALAAMRDLARRLPPPTADGVLGPRVVALSRPPDVFDPRYSNVLNLQMAALVAVLQQVDPVKRAAQDSDEAVLLRHEQKFWRRTAAHHGLADLKLPDYGTAVAAATLCRAADERSAVLVLDRLGTFGRATDDLGQVAHWLAGLYPAADGAWWGPLQPDRLGEYLVGATLKRDSDLFGRLLPGAPAQQALGALRIAARAELHQPHVAGPLRDVVVRHADRLAVVAATAATQVENPRPLRDALDTVLENTEAHSADGSVFLAELYRAVPLQTTALNAWTLGLAGRLVDQARTVLQAAGTPSGAESDAAADELAHRLNNHALRLSGVGDYQAALAAAEESAAIRRRFAPPIDSVADPQARERLGALQLSLNTLSGVQAEQQRWDEALITAAEVLWLSEALAQCDPQAYLPYLATALTNYANQLGYVGRFTEAVAPARRAVKLYQQLAAGDSETYLPDVALAFFNLAGCLESVGRPRGTLAAAKNAVANYRRAARISPDSYRADLADACFQHAAVLRTLGAHSQALAAVEESVALYRLLVESAPETHRPGLFRSLNALTPMAADVGRSQQARDASTEALVLCRELYAERPQQYGAELASALNNEAMELSEQGCDEEALELSAQCVVLYRNLARSRPLEHLPELARVLNNHADHLSEVGLLDEAEAVAAEAVSHFQVLAGDVVGTYRSELAVSLDTHARRLSACGQSQRALERSAEAVDLLRRLAGEEPAAYVPELARVLENQAILLVETGERSRACRVIEDALALRRRAEQYEPEAHREDLAAALSMAAALTAAYDQMRALAYRVEGIAVWRRLADADEDYGPNLAEALRDHAIALSRAGRRAATLKAAEEAVALYRDLLENDPEQFFADFAAALNTESIGWTELDWADPAAHADRALSAADEAQAVWQRLATRDPETREVSLGVSHHLRALNLSRLGRPEEAVAAAQDALRFWRGLAEEEPDAYDNDIAGALITLADVLSRADRHEEALGPARQAVEYYAPLVAAQDADDDVQQDAGSAWNTQAVALHNLGRHADAVASARIAVRIYRKLVKSNPEAIAPYFIEILRTYAEALDGDGQHVRAQAARTEAERLTVALIGYDDDATRSA
jgi:tetratricopeptide (TPR) repeat protein